MSFFPSRGCGKREADSKVKQADLKKLMDKEEYWINTAEVKILILILGINNMVR